MPTPVIIGIAGGTGSGKSTIADAIQKQIKSNITILTQDSYYKSYPYLSMEEREKLNYDHPETFDIELMISHLEALKKRVPVEMPVYDFSTHLRTADTIQLKPSKIVIVEGILIYENKRLREMMDIKIFVDTDPDIRILRRINRDMVERGRTLDSVIDQYKSTVRPMHIEFVEPSKKYADVIIPEGGYNKIGIEMIVAQIKNILFQKG
ncbi:uridine kinase [Candidatus Cloacimonadota bacterium]